MRKILLAEENQMYPEMLSRAVIGLTLQATAEDGPKCLEAVCGEGSNP